MKICECGEPTYSYKCSLCQADESVGLAPKAGQDDPVEYQLKILGERWTHCAKHIYDPNNPNTRALYTHPQPRTWVGLTDEERNQVMQDKTWMHMEGLCKAIEVKLKEKNT